MSFERISSGPDRMQGSPCIRGTRVTVSAILGQLAAGRSIEELREDDVQLEREDVLGGHCSRRLRPPANVRTR
jgi:uncharacterized protein (DUF433 family)